MTQQPVTFQQVTVSEAAGILGVSTQTIRRMIRRGQLEGERIHRPQGSAYLVRVPVDATAEATATQQPAPNVSRSNATGQGAPADLMAAWSAVVLAPVLAEMAAVRQAGERKDDIIREQAETIGELRAQNAALTASTATQTPEPAPWLSRFPGRSWAVYGMAGIIVLTVVVGVILFR